MKKEFLEWLEKSVGMEFEMNPFFDACLDNAIDCVMNSTINGKPIVDLYSGDRLMLQIQREFLTAARSFLKLDPGPVRFVFRDVPLKEHLHNRDKLLLQLSLLDSESEN